jgi:hypothetical protein
VEVAEQVEAREALRGLSGVIEDVAVHWSALSDEAERAQPRVQLLCAALRSMSRENSLTMVDAWVIAAV